MSGDVAGLSIWPPGSAWPWLQSKTVIVGAGATATGATSAIARRHPGQFGRLRSKPPHFGVNLDGVRKILTLICG
jgi:hypothetical protein